jgi:hypothetical protein
MAANLIHVDSEPVYDHLTVPPRRTGFDPTSGHVGFVVDKVTVGKVFSEYFGFP